MESGVKQVCDYSALVSQLCIDPSVFYIVLLLLLYLETTFFLGQPGFFISSINRGRHEGQRREKGFGPSSCWCPVPLSTSPEKQYLPAPFPHPHPILASGSRLQLLSELPKSAFSLSQAPAATSRVLLPEV